MDETIPVVWDLLTEGVLFCDEAGSVRYANGVAAELLQLDQAGLIGHRWDRLQEQIPGLQRVRLNEKTQTTQIADQLITFSVHKRPWEDGTAGQLLLLRPVTGDAALPNQFLTTLSHELRSPLTAVNGYVAMLRSGVAGPLNEKQEQLLEPLERNVSRLVQRMNSLIFAASINTGHQEYQQGYADIRQLISQIAREQQAHAAAQEIVIQTDVDYRLGQIEVDPMHLATVLEELVGNSIKYGRARTTIYITATLQAQQFAVVSVRDEGIGISPAAQRRLFEPFYRPEERDQEVTAGGMGIGLSVVRSLVEAYDGRIWCESVFGQGTTFSFVLPLKRLQNG